MGSQYASKDEICSACRLTPEQFDYLKSKNRLPRSVLPNDTMHRSDLIRMQGSRDFLMHRTASLRELREQQLEAERKENERLIKLGRLYDSKVNQRTLAKKVAAEVGGKPSDYLDDEEGAE